MWLTSAAIRRPVLITMLFAALVVMGLINRSRMPTEQRPKVDFPYVSIVTVYAGAGPQEIETLVTKKIEDAVGSIANIKNVTSTSQDGISVVSIEFELGTDLATAAADVREKVDSIRADLPVDAKPPGITKADISAIPVMALGMKGPLSARELRRIADDIVKDRLARVSGAAAVAVNGGDLREIQVLVNKARLNAYGLTISEVAEAIRSENMNVPGGSIKQGRLDYSVRVVGEFASADEMGRMRIHIPDRKTGGPGWNIKLSDIAEVLDTTEDSKTISKLNGKPAVLLAVQKQSDANTIDVARGVRKELDDLKPQLPPGVEFIIAMDESEFVLDQMNDTNHELIFSIILVVLVVFLFLHSARATFIVSIAIPTSLIATFIPMTLMGFTLNFMTMLALTLAVGILVDDAIVVLENIDRHLKEGEPPREAALNGRTEIGLAAVSITLVDVVVFIPIAFMGGIVGQFFKSFGITVASATLFSLFVSFSLTPMMASRFYKRETRKTKGHHGTGLWAGFWDKCFTSLEAGFARIDKGYRNLLGWSLDNRWLTVVIGLVSLTTILIMLMPPLDTPFGAKARIFNLVAFVGLLGGSTLFFARDRRAALIFIIAAAVATLFIHLRVKGEFIPELDRGNVAVTVEAPAGSSLKYTMRITDAIEEILAKMPETDLYQTIIGSKSSGGFMGGGDTGPQYGRISVTLVDNGSKEVYRTQKIEGRNVRKLVQRKRGIAEFMEDLRQQVAKKVPGAKVTIFSAESTQVGTAPIAMEIQGANNAELTTVANRYADAISKVPGTRDVEVSWKVGRPELAVTVNRERAMDLGVSTAQIASALRTSIEGDTTSKFRVQGTEYNIRVQVRPEDRSTLASARQIIVGNTDGTPIYLDDVADVRLDAAPTKIDRKNRQRQVTVSAFLQSGFDLSAVQASVDNAIANLPRGNTVVNTGGTSKAMQESFEYMISALGLAILLVYMLMAALFESYFNPLVIMFSLPQALVGALLMLVLRGQSLSIVSMIGVILLMGIVTKNAILLIDFINTLRARGHDRREAILIAGPTRLRPILMTTSSLIAALLPTMFALSKGAEQRSPLATAVVGGLLVSTMLTLLVIPASYTLTEDLVQKTVGRIFRRKHKGVIE